MRRSTSTVASFLCWLALPGALASSPAIAASAVALVSSRATLIDPQTVNWDQLGPAGTQVSQPFQASASGGYTFTVLKNNSDTPYVRADEGDGFTGDFLPGEKLLYSTSLTAFDFRFQTPIESVGGQIQIDRGGQWTPFVRVFTTDGGDFTFTLPPDFNNQSADGSAPFVGVTANSPVISRILFDSFFGGNTGINQLSIVVPEPTPWTLFFAIVTLRCRRRRASASR